jgi:hypothetical protein
VAAVLGVTRRRWLIVPSVCLVPEVDAAATARDVLRTERPPDDLLLVVRGGVGTLNDIHLADQAADCWARCQFFGVSVSSERPTTTWLRER